MKKKILITGGLGDIAQAIKKELINSNNYEILSPGRTELDVTNAENIERIVSKFRPDILINNAGYVKPQSIKNADLKTTKRHIDINLLGMFYCTEICLKYNNNLQIINIGSAAAIEIHSTWSEYCATKAAAVMATKCWAEDDLYSVIISPGRTKTKMRKSLFPMEDPETLLLPEDFAKIVIKAVNKEYKTGSHIIVRKQNVTELLKRSVNGEIN